MRIRLSALLLLAFLVILGMDAGIVFSQTVPLEEDWITVRDRYIDYYENIPNQRGNGLKPWNRWLWEYDRRVYPNNDISGNRRFTALQYIREHMLPNNELDEVWVEMGPANIAGRMLCITFDPQDPNIMYTGSASGGIWKSETSGLSWFPIDDYLPTLAVGYIVVDPTDSDIIYMGTGEGNYNGDAVWGVGVLKTLDGGVTWDTTGLNWGIRNSDAVNEMAIDPENPDRLFAACNSGVYRTEDAGVTWEMLLAGPAKHIQLRPGQPDTMYTTLGNPWGAATNGVWRSQDGGDNWTHLTNGLADANIIGRVSIAISQSNPDILVAGIAGDFSYNSSELVGFYTTDNGGDNWMLMAITPNFYNQQGWYDNISMIKPDDPNVVLAGGLDMYRSNNRGIDWDQVSWWYHNPGPTFTHADLHAYAWHPDDPDRLYVGSDGGVFESTDSGVNWQDRNDGLSTMQFYAMGGAYLDETIAYGGTQDQGTNKYSGTNQWESVYGGDGGECVVDYTNSDIVYGEWQYGNHFRSLNGGVTWTSIMESINGDGAWVAPVIMDHNDPNTLYTATNRVYVSNNRGTTVRAISENLGSTLETLSQDYFDHQVLYAARNSNAWRTDDGGGTWVSISDRLPNFYITEIQADPVDADMVWVVFSSYDSQHVWRSSDRGENWESVSEDLPDLPTNAIEIAPGQPKQVFIGTDLGVFYSLDEGENWMVLGEGLPNVVVDDLDLHIPTMTLRAATHGRGMWEIPVSGTGLILIDPNGDEQLAVGSNTEISWVANGIEGTLTIELNRDFPDGDWETLSDNAPVDEDYVWMVTGPESENARIRIASNTTPEIADTSAGNFSIVAPFIEVVEPIPGFDVGVGISLPITWNSFGVPGGVNIEVNRDYPDGDWELIYEDESNPGAYTWSVDGALTDNARLRVISSDLPSLYDEMDGDFMIVEPALALTYPVGGETWRINENVTLQIDESGLLGDVYYLISRSEPVSWRPLSGATPVDSLYSWEVVGPPSSTARIKVVFYAPNSIVLMDSTEAVFEILDENASPEPGVVLPESDILDGCYPNPFNNRTTVRFGLAHSGDILLRVFNVEGRLVETLRQGRWEAGYHEIPWNAESYSSGTYFIRLDTRQYSYTVRTTLAK